MNEQKMKEVFSDEQFVKSLLELETPEEVQKVLAEKEIDVTEEEIVKAREILIRYNNGELSEEELENVAGGGLLSILGGVVAGLIANVVYSHVTRRRW